MINKKSVGEFKPTDISINYTNVDIKKKQVTANILYKDEIKTTITIDLDSNKIHQDGDFTELLNILPSKDENSYIEEIKGWAEIFIENEITDPKKYFESFLN